MNRPVLLPGRCVLCGDGSGSGALCKPCLLGLPGLGPACPRCALPASNPELPCGACLQRAPPWGSARAALRYEFPVDRLVQQLKYQRQLAAGRALAAAMVRYGMPRWDAPAQAPRPWLVPVPLHWTRETRRGFNQARELGLHLSRATGWPLHDRWLRRVRRTAPQASLASQLRQRSLLGAFRWHGPCLAGRYVILLDDVLTTGATAAACCHALSAAASTSLWVAARALQPGPPVATGQSASKAQRS